MERIARDLTGPYTLTANAYDAEGADTAVTGAVTAALYGPDAALITDAGIAAAISSGDIIVTVPITAAVHLGRYIVRVTGTVGGVAKTWSVPFEIVGGFYFEIYELRVGNELASLADTTRFPDATLKLKRAAVEDTIEGLLGFALVPRGDVHDAIAARDGELELPRPEIRSIVSLTVNGTALTVTELANLTLRKRAGSITGGTWRAGDTLVCWYEHGLDEPPADIVSGALELAIDRTAPTGLPRRVKGMSTDLGYQSFTIAGGDSTGLPELDLAIERLTVKGTFVG